MENENKRQDCADLVENKKQSAIERTIIRGLEKSLESNRKESIRNLMIRIGILLLCISLWFLL
ncbi:hypothetical protein HKH62_04660 [Vibrio cholerae]|uniref:hypothetical protein n=1 Tax=Vibrio cholerae TaxID=666 RepID=UPI001C91DCAD|nr:hypothetical protein [Vibrio cholerae]MBY3671859.1 hypothetical protein [Vibrio cholerae]